MQASQISKNKDYLTQNYSQDEHVPHEELILTVQNYYIKKEGSFQLGDIVGLQKPVQQLKKYLKSKNNQMCLILGAPGTGKTFTVKALRSEFKQLTFIHIPISDLVSIPSDQIQTIFKMAAFYTPSVMIFDELDFGATSLQNQFFQIKNNIKNPQFRNCQIKFIAIANNPEKIVLQNWPNITQCIHFPSLKPQLVLQLFIKQFNKVSSKIQFDPVNKQKIMDVLKSKKDIFSGSDVKCITSDAMMSPIRRYQKLNPDVNKWGQLNQKDFFVTFQDLLQAIKKANSSITKDQYEKIQQACQKIDKALINSL